MSNEQLYASFLLDRREGIEVALPAESVAEATPVVSRIRPLPTTVDFLEGVMHLRDASIPVINLKKRLGLGGDYDDEAKVAVISRAGERYGLLFDDIKEVFRADSSALMPISSGLLTEDRVITSLLSLDAGRRTIELLNPEHVLKGDTELAAVAAAPPVEHFTWKDYVVFHSGGQTFAVPVEVVREITFTSSVDPSYRDEHIDGALMLREVTLPIFAAGTILSGVEINLDQADEEWRVLVLHLQGCTFGLIVESVERILSIPLEKVMDTPVENRNMQGVYKPEGRENIVLLNLKELLAPQLEEMETMFRLGKYSNSQQESEAERSGANHLLTENGWLIFSVGYYLSLEIKSVQEILDSADIFPAPGESGAIVGLINLRGELIPVICLRRFLDLDEVAQKCDDCKYIVCRGAGRTIAFRCAEIVTIFKEEKFYDSPSLPPRWKDKKDVLDKLLHYSWKEKGQEQVFVLNTDAFVINHLSSCSTAQSSSMAQGIAGEKSG